MRLSLRLPTLKTKGTHTTRERPKSPFSISCEQPPLSRSPARVQEQREGWHHLRGNEAPDPRRLSKEGCTV